MRYDRDSSKDRRVRSTPPVPPMGGTPAGAARLGPQIDRIGASPPELTVYLIAFTCEPGRGSEPGVGWAFAEAVAVLTRARGWNAVVVTRPHRRQRIERALLEQGHRHVQVLTVPVPRLLWIRGGRDVRIAAVVWQWKAVQSLRRRLRDHPGAALVHHVTFATEAVPTFEGRLRSQACLVFGPAGSTLEGGERTVRRRLRRLLSTAVLRDSDLLVATNEQVAGSWRRRTNNRVVTEPNIVVESQEQHDEGWDIAIVGHLIERKRIDLALRSIGRIGRSLRVAVVGDGPLRADLERLAVELSLGDDVRFFGSLTRDATLDTLSRTRVLLHTSRQEGAGWVIGEAQAAGAFVVTVAGAGGDSAARAGAAAIASVPTPDAIASAILEGLSAPRPAPSSRWSKDRLPQLLETWYAAALDEAALRVSRGRHG